MIIKVTIKNMSRAEYWANYPFRKCHNPECGKMGVYDSM
jgi:hypothetical protein